MGFGHEKDCAGEEQRLLLTWDPTSHQKGHPTSTTPQLSWLKEKKKRRKKLVAGPRWVPDTKKNGRLTVSHNTTFTFTLSEGTLEKGLVDEWTETERTLERSTEGQFQKGED
jgi:hypothetical protein